MSEICSQGEGAEAEEGDLSSFSLYFVLNECYLPRSWFKTKNPSLKLRYHGLKHLDFYLDDEPKYLGLNH